MALKSVTWYVALTRLRRAGAWGRAPCDHAARATLSRRRTAGAYQHEGEHIIVEERVGEHVKNHRNRLEEQMEEDDPLLRWRERHWRLRQR